MPADLFEDHRAIIAAADDLLAVLREVPRRRMDEIGQMRVRLGSLTMAHLRAEEELLLRPLIASGRINEIPQADAVLADIREGRTVYSDHIRKWTPQAIDADFTGYVAAVTDLVERTNMLARREETDLYRPAYDLLASAPRQSEAG